jgi:hypothetical protein
VNDVEITDPNLREITRLDSELYSAHREVERLNKQLADTLRERNEATRMSAGMALASIAADVRDMFEGCLSGWRPNLKGHR